MKSRQTNLVLSTAALLAACAGPMGPMSGPVTNQHMSHHAATPAMQDRLKDMQTMRDKMSRAKSPAKRQALMAEHMKAMWRC